MLFLGLHLLLTVRGIEIDQLIIPVVGILFILGLIMINRLIGAGGVWQQMSRGFLPGIVMMGVLILYPNLVERIRTWAVPISLIGLALPILTAMFGVVDETGSRLALKLGPLPAIQTSELLKVALLIFLAWFVESSGEAVEGRGLPLFGWLRLPAVRYLMPGVLFTIMGTLALTAMSDFGAVMILALLFVGMLFAGFDLRTFSALIAIGVVLSLLMGLVLATTWHVPDVIRNRFLAFQNPWSSAEVVIGGKSTGITIAEGPGYQLQQAIYAVVAGGLTGSGVGMGSPDFIPLAASDFIFAAILEEMGAIVGIGILGLFLVLLLRLLRIAGRLPPWQVFERMLLVGIAIHLFTQVFVMMGGTLALIPMTGVTIPFMSLGGTAVFVNLTEIGLALAIAQRLERRPA